MSILMVVAGFARQDQRKGAFGSLTAEDFGKALNQVLLSASTTAIVQDALLDELGLRDLGEHRLKSLPRPERIFQLLIPGLPADFPPLQTLDSRTGLRLGSEGERVLTTVLITDIVPHKLYVQDLELLREKATQCTWPDESGHIWEAQSPHLCCTHK